MNLKNAKRAGVTWEVEAQDEHLSVRGNALGTDNSDENKKEEDRILKELENGNIWAWCCVKVSAHFEGYEGCVYLGACSYQDRKDFEHGPYFQDMKKEALDSLLSTLRSVVKDGEDASSTLEKLS